MLRHAERAFLTKTHTCSFSTEKPLSERIRGVSVDSKPIGHLSLMDLLLLGRRKPLNRPRLGLRQRGSRIARATSYTPFFIVRENSSARAHVDSKKADRHRLHQRKCDTQPQTPRRAHARDRAFNSSIWSDLWAIRVKIHVSKC